MVIQRLIRLYTELIFNEVYNLKSFNVKMELDIWGNNILHYLVFFENEGKLEKFVNILVEFNYGLYMKLVEQTNRFDESPKDWALAIENEKLREEIYSLLTIRVDSWFGKTSPSLSTHNDFQPQKFSTYYVVPSLKNKETYGDDYTSSFIHYGNKEKLNFHPVYGKNLLKEIARKSLIPHSTLYYFCKTQEGINLKAQFIEPRFRRAYLHFYYFFENSTFTLEQAKIGLSQVKEDVSNINLTIKRLIDSKLAIKIQQEATTKPVEIRNPAGRPKSQYKLREFFTPYDECASLIKDRLNGDSGQIGRLLNPIRAMFRWFESDVTDREHLLMINSLIRSYRKVFKGEVFFDKFDFYSEYDQIQRRRGRKEESAEIPLWVRSVANFSEKVFERIWKSEIELSDLDLLSLLVELFHHRAKSFGDALSYELKGFIAGLIIDKIAKNFKNQTVNERTNSINLLIPHVDIDLTFLFVLIYLVKDNKRVNLYLTDSISPELKSIFEYLVERFDVNLDSLTKLHLRNYARERETSETFLIANFSSQFSDKYDEERNNFISNLIDEVRATSILIFPNIQENELIELSKENSLKRDLLIGRIYQILRRHHLRVHNIDSRASFIKLRDSAPSGSLGTYGILLLHDDDTVTTNACFTVEIESYSFTLTWIRECLRTGKLNFILQYPREYLSGGNRIVKLE